MFLIPDARDYFYSSVLRADRFENFDLLQMLSTSRHYSPRDALRLVFCPQIRARVCKRSTSTSVNWSHCALPSPPICATSLAMNRPCLRMQPLSPRHYDFAQISRRRASTSTANTVSVSTGSSGHDTSDVPEPASKAPKGRRKRRGAEYFKLRQDIKKLGQQLDAVGIKLVVPDTFHNVNKTTTFKELKSLIHYGRAQLAAVRERPATNEDHQEEQVKETVEATKATSHKNGVVSEMPPTTSYEIAWLFPKWRNSVRRKLKKELIKLMKELEQAGSPFVPPSYIKVVQTEGNIKVQATNRVVPKRSLAGLRIDDAHLKALVNQCRRQLAAAKTKKSADAANAFSVNLPDTNGEPEYVSELIPLLSSESLASEVKKDDKQKEEKASKDKADNEKASKENSLRQKALKQKASKEKAAKGKTRYSIGNMLRSIAVSVMGPTDESAHADQVASQSGFEITPSEITASEITDTAVNSVASPQKSSTKIANATDAKSATKSAEQPKSVAWTEITADKAPEPIDPGPQSPIATLAHGLDRVLFNPGIHWLQDPRSQVYNFDPYLQGIMQPDDFDYSALPPYIRPSSHSPLQQLARKHGKKYIGSTSSMSGFMSHLYFLISGWKPVNTFQLSAVFRDQPRTFTSASKAPGAIHVVNDGDLYSINAGKTGGDNDSILSLLGRSMEKMLTLPPEEVEKYRKKNSWQISKEDREKSEAYHYSQFGDFLLRSQLDCIDPRLPNKTFDIKTRAVIAIRLDQKNYEDNSGYALRRAHGLLESFEREYYDMTRSAFLKYSMQVRIGNMDGIIVAYHNTQRIFGFQYISLAELDERLFGSTEMGEQAFSLILGLFNGILDKVTALYPGRSVSLDFETATAGNELVIYAEPYDKGDKEYTKRKTARLNNMLDDILRSRDEKAKGEERSSSNNEAAASKEALMETDSNTEPSHPDVTKIMVRAQSSLNGHVVKGSVYFPLNYGDALVNPPKWTLKYDIETKRSLDLTREKAIAMEDQMWAMRKKALKMTSLEDLLAERAAHLMDRQKFIQDTAKMAEGVMAAEKKAADKAPPKGLLKTLRDISNRRKKEEEAKKVDEQPKIMWVPHSGRADVAPKQRDIVS